MDFRTLLEILHLASTSGVKEFESRLLGLGLLSTDTGRQLEPKYKKLLSTKSLSNDLDRLYRMGFLKRRRVKRPVMLESGKEVHRGFKYIYSLSSRGKNYINFMHGKQTINPEREMDMMADAVHKITPIGYRALAEEVYDLFIRSPKKSNPRFQAKNKGYGTDFAG